MPSFDYTLTVPSEISLSRPATTQGFGEYEQFSEQEFKVQQTAQKTYALAATIFSGAGGAAVIAAVIFLSIPVIPASFALGGLAAFGVYSYMKYRTIQNQFPPSLTEGLNPRDFNAKRVGETIQEQGQAAVLSDSVASKKCKLDLIRYAQSSIFLSCYMEGEAFDEALHLIKERMNQNAQLKVFIFGSDHFLTPENKRRVEALQTAHPNRFFTVLNPEIYLSQHPQNGHLALSTNHIKLMSIDQGAYTVCGGTALRPYWTNISGTEHLPRAKTTFDFYNPLDAKGFRDMDFAFKSAPNGAGTTAFLEGAKLMLRYAYMQDPALATKLKGEFQTLMRRPPSAAVVPSLDARTDRANNVRVKWYSSGPDHTQNSYLQAMIDLVNNATRKIRIAHMYFHPPQSFIDALSNAAKRGVKIEIITNSKSKDTPGSHRFFVDLAQTKYRQLFEREGHQNVKVHEFYRASTTYHKKVMVVDDRFTAFGSSNLGKKSLAEHADDYEFNGIVDSQELARATNQVLQKDIELSDDVSPENAKNLSWDTKLLGRFQELIMSHIL